MGPNVSLSVRVLVMPDDRLQRRDGEPSHAGLPIIRGEQPSSFYFFAEPVEPDNLSAAWRLVGSSAGRGGCNWRRSQGWSGGALPLRAGLWDRDGGAARRAALSPRSVPERACPLPPRRQLGFAKLFELQAELHGWISKTLNRGEGNTSRSATPPNDNPNFEAIFRHDRSQNWCCSTTVISFGYCASIRGDSRTPSARVSKVM